MADEKPIPPDQVREATAQDAVESLQDAIRTYGATSPEALDAEQQYYETMDTVGEQEEQEGY